MNLEISDELEEAIKASSLDRTEAIVYCLTVHFLGDEGVAFLIERNLITPDNEHLYRINLTNVDYEDDRLTLRYPVLMLPKSDEFSKFIAALMNVGFTPMGHPSNPMSYAVISDSAEVRREFNTLHLRIPALDVDRLVTVTSEYYSSVEKAKGLGRFLSENAFFSYTRPGEINKDYEGRL